MFEYMFEKFLEVGLLSQNIGTLVIFRVGAKLSSRECVPVYTLKSAIKREAFSTLIKIVLFIFLIYSNFINEK